MEHRKFKTLNVNNLWQCETTQKSLIIKLSAFGKLTFIKYLSIRTNQVNLKVRFCVVLLSKMAVYTEFYPVIFHFEIQKKYGKHLKIQKIFWICLSNTIYKLIMAEPNLFLQYKASTVPWLHFLRVTINWFEKINKKKREVAKWRFSRQTKL